MLKYATHGSGWKVKWGTGRKAWKNYVRLGRIGRAFEVSQNKPSAAKQISPINSDTKAARVQFCCLRLSGIKTTEHPAVSESRTNTAGNVKKSAYFKKLSHFHRCGMTPWCTSSAADIVQ